MKFRITHERELNLEVEADAIHPSSDNPIAFITTNLEGTQAVVELEKLPARIDKNWFGSSSSLPTIWILSKREARVLGRPFQVTRSHVGEVLWERPPESIKTTIGEPRPA